VDQNCCNYKRYVEFHMNRTLEEWGIDSLNIDERLELAQQIWESIATELESQPLSELQRVELERRIAVADANPSEGIPWKQVRDEARARWQRRV
jgi:putative addiction module component (TIGR02574 family)